MVPHGSFRHMGKKAVLLQQRSLRCKSESIPRPYLHQVCCSGADIWALAPSCASSAPLSRASVDLRFADMGRFHARTVITRSWRSERGDPGSPCSLPDWGRRTWLVRAAEAHGVASYGATMAASALSSGRAGCNVPTGQSLMPFPHRLGDLGGPPPIAWGLV